MTTLSTYHNLVAGLTQEETAFRDAVIELDIKANFYGIKNRALNQLNRAALGYPIDKSNPINVVGLLDFKLETLALAGQEREILYELDHLDPAYVDYIKATILAGNGKLPDQVPMSELALELLDKEFQALEDKPELDNVLIPRNEIDASMAQSRRAFANEMLLLVQLEEFIKDNNLEGVMSTNMSDLLLMVEQHRYHFNFNDVVEDLTAKVTEPLNTLERG